MTMPGLLWSWETMTTSKNMKKNCNYAGPDNGQGNENYIGLGPSCLRGQGLPA